MIEVKGLTKTYGSKTVVDGADFTVRPGHVTGFLGPNGAGKSTTMRMMLGIDRSTSGTATVNGHHYGDLPVPLREVGALLDAKAIHGGRTAHDHLLWLARSSGIPRRRVDQVLGMVGLQDVAAKQPKGFSLGMGQRLGIAAALLGDPGVLMFDEPVNGLDPEGIVWIRELMRSLAAEGRCVFVSSHLMSEMALTADHLVVIGRGRILADTSMREFTDSDTSSHVRVASPQASDLARLLAGTAWRVESDEPGTLRIFGPTTREVGDLAANTGIGLHELTYVQASLEAAFMRLTSESVEYQAAAPEPTAHDLSGSIR
ncbi:ABC transporter ATP-binding protein [Streptomyces niveus]